MVTDTVAHYIYTYINPFNFVHDKMISMDFQFVSKLKIDLLFVKHFENVDSVI